MSLIGTDFLRACADAFSALLRSNVHFCANRRMGLASSSSWPRLRNGRVFSGVSRVAVKVHGLEVANSRTKKGLILLTRGSKIYLGTRWVSMAINTPPIVPFKWLCWCASGSELLKSVRRLWFYVQLLGLWSSFLNATRATLGLCMICRFHYSPSKDKSERYQSLSALTYIDNAIEMYGDWEQIR